MTAQTKLEIEGTLTEHPLAELLAETTGAALSGSFRLTYDKQKIIIYLDKGRIVYAVSNIRRHRLFDILLRSNKITKQQLFTIERIGNDLELGEKLISLGLIAPAELDQICARQVAEIVSTGLVWKTGDWFYSSLLRVKTEIKFKINENRLLLKYARGLSSDYILSRFGSADESLGVKADLPMKVDIQSHEAFILSRFENSFLTLAEIDALSGMSDKITRQALYTLWLGGFLIRRNWDQVFSQSRIKAILSARLRLKRGEDEVEIGEPAAPTEAVPTGINLSQPASEPVVEEPEEEIDEEQIVQNYLEKIERATNLYEVLDIPPDAEMADIKRSYFSRAKNYHPDLFHQAETELHRRIQSAFTEIAHAYETLKDQKSREIYDYKMRKELEEMKKRQATGATEKDINLDRQAERAAENFEMGLDILTRGEASDAVPFLARAVHFGQGKARYHAYYGKALSADKNQLHKAEGELQTAIRIEPENTTYRLMLAELFVHIGLIKRAEGELTRLLAIKPGDTEALALLDSLQRK